MSLPFGIQRVSFDCYSALVKVGSTELHYADGRLGFIDVKPSWNPVDDALTKKMLDLVCARGRDRALTATVTLIRPPACMTHITTTVTIPRFEFCDLGRWRQSLSRYCIEKDETQRPIISEDRANFKILVGLRRFILGPCRLRLLGPHAAAF